MYEKEAILKTLHDIADEAQSVRPYFFLAQPRRRADDVPAQKIEGFHGLHIDVCGYSHNVGVIHGQPVDVARNYLCEEALKSGAKYLVFIGDDTVFPYDGIRRLHATAEANPRTIVVGVYWMKLSSPIVMVKEGDWVKPADTRRGQLIDVFTAGLDCALIPVQLLREMKELGPTLPFCCCNAEGAHGLPMIGEDNFFYHRAHKLGWKTLCNTDVQCLHIDCATGKYTAAEDVNLGDYITNMPITTRLEQSDKRYIDTRWKRELSDKPTQTEAFKAEYAQEVKSA